MKDLIVGWCCSMSFMGALAMTGNQAQNYMMGNENKELHLATYVLAFQEQEAAVRLNAQIIIKNNLSVPVWPFCTPKGTTTQQAVDIIKRAIYSEPENNHQPLFIISRRALSKVWECTKSQLLAL